MTIMQSFETPKKAVDWMVSEVDDPFIDNERFAFLDDADAMGKYADQQNEGCCGSFDIEIIVQGRAATIGCNFGH